MFVVGADCWILFEFSSHYNIQSYTLTQTGLPLQWGCLFNLSLYYLITGEQNNIDYSPSYDSFSPCTQSDTLRFLRDTGNSSFQFHNLCYWTECSPWVPLSYATYVNWVGWRRRKSEGSLELCLGLKARNLEQTLNNQLFSSSLSPTLASLNLWRKEVFPCLSFLSLDPTWPL